MNLPIEKNIFCDIIFLGLRFENNARRKKI